MNEKIKEIIKIRDALLLLQRLEEKSERLEQQEAKTEKTLNATDQVLPKIQNTVRCGHLFNVVHCSQCGSLLLGATRERQPKEEGWLPFCSEQCIENYFADIPRKHLQIYNLIFARGAP